MAQDKSKKEQISQLIQEISVGLHERDEIVALALLAILSGQSVFLYGPPGTAKSLIARRLSLAFKEPKYFEYLMNRFSTPEEVFGPVSIKELKEDRYIRKTKGYLPEADIAFLDEIWKSSPAILNTLLTIINERKFRNGDTVIDVPLKGIVAASNEIPAENQGLEALYDRFIMRLVVNPMTERSNFDALLNDIPTEPIVPVNESLTFDAQKWNDALASLNDVVVSKETLNVIHAIRVKIDEYNKKDANKSNPIYISDRRWQKMARVLKMAAYLCDRNEVKPVDALILKDCLWTKEDNKEALSKMVRDSVREFCVFSSDKFEKWNEEYMELKQEIDDTFFCDSGAFEDVEEIDGKKYFRVKLNIPCLEKNKNNRNSNSFDPYSIGRSIGLGAWSFSGRSLDDTFDNYSIVHQKVSVYLPYDCFKTVTSFVPLDKSHEPLSEYRNPVTHFNYAKTTIQCNFNGSISCTVKYSYTERDDRLYKNPKEETETIVIKPSYKVGNCKKVPLEVKKMYQQNMEELLSKFDLIKKDIDDFYYNFTLENITPFVSKKDQTIVTAVVADFKKQMNVGRLNAEQLMKKLKQHINP